MNHPNARDLEFAAVGDLSPVVKAHLSGCSDCSNHVTLLRDASEKYGGSKRIDVFAAKIFESTPVRTQLDYRSRHWKTGLGKAAPWVGLVGMAAATWFFLRTPHLLQVRQEEGVTEGRFKGKGPALTVIRERNGNQVRVTQAFSPQVGDRIRLEVSLEQTMPITAGLLELDGTWTELLSRSERTVGTYYSDSAARVDANGIAGWFIAGSPEEVDLARKSRQFDRVSVLAISKP